MTGRASEAVGRVFEVAGLASQTAGSALQIAGRYYQKHAFENRVNIMILHSTVNRPLVALVKATLYQRLSVDPYITLS